MSIRLSVGCLGVTAAMAVGVSVSAEAQEFIMNNVTDAAPSYYAAANYAGGVAPDYATSAGYDDVVWATNAIGFAQTLTMANWNPTSESTVFAGTLHGDACRRLNNAIGYSNRYLALSDLAKASPAPIPLSIRGQRQSTGQILYLDWRWENPTENPARIYTPINQRAEDPRWTAHLRFVTVSFPLLDLEVQTALWLGIIASQKLRIRLILLILNDRLGFGYLEAVIRLAECDNRVPGGVPGEMVCEDRLTKRDFEFQQEQADELKRLLQSDPDPKYRCSSAGLDPLNCILLPGNDGNGTSSTIVWAERPDFDNDMLY